jgi:periplasmic copper chaperone A
MRTLRFSTISASVLATLVIAIAPPVEAAEVKAGTLVIDSPWTRATPGGAKVAGGYMTISNTGAAPDRLIGGSFPRAARFEVHEMQMDGSVMRMRPLPNGLEIKPHQAVKLAPGGYHLMFMGLKQPLKQGEKIKGQLVFEKAGTVNVEYVVESIGAQSSGQGGDHGAAHGGGGHGGH